MPRKTHPTNQEEKKNSRKISEKHGTNSHKKSKKLMKSYQVARVPPQQEC